VLANCSGNVLSGSDVTSNSFGIQLHDSPNNTLFYNNVTNNNPYGIWLDSSSNNTLSGNSVKTSSSVGIDLYYSSGNTLYSNSVTQTNYAGIYLDSSSNNTLFSNSVTGNNYGLRIEASNNNVLFGNSVSNNSVGILAISSNNTIFHNDFVDNVRPVYVFVFESVNLWDDGYPSGGNYWSDYNGSDINGGIYQNETGYDWIGDSPYIIDQNNTDRYPLMNPFSPETDEIRIAYRTLLRDYNTSRLL
jgi:parallel beta-helix repeat protein